MGRSSISPGLLGCLALLASAGTALAGGESDPLSAGVVPNVRPGVNTGVFPGYGVAGLPGLLAAPPFDPSAPPPEPPRFAPADLQLRPLPACPLVIRVGAGLRRPARTRIVYGRPGCV